MSDDNVDSSTVVQDYNYSVHGNEFGSLRVEKRNADGMRIRDQKFHSAQSLCDKADSVKAEDLLDDVPGEPVVAVLSGGSYVPYMTFASRSDVDDDIASLLVDRGYAVITDVDAGWMRWGGRPEFSNSCSRIDFSDTKVVGVNE